MKVYIVFKIGSYDGPDETIGAYASRREARLRAERINGRFEMVTLGNDRAYRKEVKAVEAQEAAHKRWQAEMEAEEARTPPEPDYTPEQFQAYLDAHTTSTCACPDVVGWVVRQDAERRRMGVRS